MVLGPILMFKRYNLIRLLVFVALGRYCQLQSKTVLMH